MDRDNIVEFPTEEQAFEHQHLLGVEQLTPPNIATILNLTRTHFRNNREDKAAAAEENILRGRRQVNLFFEDSTRTRESFSTAGERLGAEVINKNLASSSMNKGETMEDTIAALSAMRTDTPATKLSSETPAQQVGEFSKNKTIGDTIAAVNKMNPDILVVRHNQNGAVHKIASGASCAVINAGDGTNEHPTQALLDAFVMREHFGNIAGLRVAICGDVAHSRVARSNILLLEAMGADVHIVAPDEFLSVNLAGRRTKIFTNMKEGLKGCDVVMALRIQRERLQSKVSFSRAEYFNEFGLDYAKLKYAKPDAIVMHPGPMNRGVEIDSALADDPARSLIKLQVEAGVATRQAVLELLILHSNNNTKQMVQTHK